MILEKYVSPGQLALLSIKLNELDFPVRAKNVFNRNEIITIKDLLIHTGGDYHLLRNIGQGIAEDIQAVLDPLGIDIIRFASLTLHSLPLSPEMKRHLLKANIYYKEELLNMSTSQLFIHLKAAYPITNPKDIYAIVEAIYKKLSKRQIRLNQNQDLLLIESSLPAKTQRILVENGLFFQSDLLKYTKRELNGLPGIGLKELRQIEKIYPELPEDYGYLF